MNYYDSEYVLTYLDWIELDKKIHNDKFNYVTNKNIINNKGITKLIDVDIEFIDKPHKIHSNLVVRTEDKTIGLAKVINVI